MSSPMPFHMRYPMPDQQTHRGVYFPGFPVTNSKEGLEQIREFQVRSDDIVLSSYPKTGSRWMAEMISWICGGDGEEGLQTSSNAERVRHIEANMPSKNIDVLTNLPTTTQRIYSTHLRRDFAPQEVEKAGRIIIGVRNPKDAAVSNFYFYRSMKFLGSYDGPWDEFLHGYMNGELAMGSYFDWIVSWWPIARQANVMVLKYEDAKKYPEKTIKEVAQFLGKTLSEERVKLVMEKTSFSTMKASGTTNFSKDPNYAKFFSEQKENVSEYIRKGVVGDWKTHFTVKQSEEFDELTQEKLAGVELHFDYE